MEKQYAGDTATTAATAMQDAARDPKAAADDATRQAGETLKSTADQLRAGLPESGMAGHMADAVTDGVKQAATHLQEQGFGGLIDDVIDIARRYPIQTLLVGLGCGLLLARRRH